MQTYLPAAVLLLFSYFNTFHAMKFKIYLSTASFIFFLTLLMPTSQNCIYCSSSPFLYTLLGLLSSVKGAQSISAAAILVEGILNQIKTGILIWCFINFFSSLVWLISLRFYFKKNYLPPYFPTNFFILFIQPPPHFHFPSAA